MVEFFRNVNEILDFAIKEEEKARDFYLYLAKRVERPAMKKNFEEFAGEEQKHKERLLEVKEGKRTAKEVEEVPDMKMSDYLVNVTPSRDMDYGDALILAMKREKAAYRLYTRLAEVVEDENMRQVFQGLASEEAKHKMAFEVEYDEHYMSEN